MTKQYGSQLEPFNLVEFKELATSPATPSSGPIAYFKNDGKLYKKGTDGVETEIGGGGGGGSTADQRLAMFYGNTAPTASDIPLDGSILPQAGNAFLYSKIGKLPKFKGGNFSNTNNGGITQIAYNPNTNKYLGVSATGIYLASNLYNWELQNTNIFPTASLITHVIYSSFLNKFILVNGTPIIHVSADGKDWIAIQTKENVQWTHIASSSTVICAYGTQATYLGINRVYTTSDTALLSWNNTTLTGSTVNGATSDDLYYAPAQDMFCLALNTPRIYQISNSATPTVTARTAPGNARITQFTSNSTTIYASGNSSGIYFSTDLMSTWAATATTTTVTTTCSGVAVDESSDFAKLVGVSSVGIISSQVTPAAGTTYITHPVNLALPVQNKNEFICYNPNVSVRKYARVNAATQCPGSIVSSSDLAVWHNTDSSLSAVTYSFSCIAANPNPGGLTVACGANGIIYTSADHVTFTSRTSGTTNAFLHIIWSTITNQFIALTATQIFTSPDGITWTSRTAAIATNINGIIEGNGIVLITTSNPTNANNYQTSTDGITWTGRQLNSGDTILSSTYNGNVFAIGTTGMNDLYTSIDGITSWNRVASFRKSGLLVSSFGTKLVTYFYSTGGSTQPVNFYSEDNGLSWKVYLLPGITNGYMYVNGIGVIMGLRGSFYTSTDGKTYIQKVPPQAGTYRRAYRFNSTYVLPTDTGVVISTDNGRTFKQPYYTGSFLDVVNCYNFSTPKLLLSQTKGSIYYSTDSGAYWYPSIGFINTSTTGMNFGQIAYSPTLNIAVAVDYTSGFASYTTDGETWMQCDFGFREQSPNGVTGALYGINSIIWSSLHSKFVCVLSGGFIGTSTDGITFTIVSIGNECTLNEITLNTALGKYCVVGNNGIIYTSTDLVAWTKKVPPVRNINLSGVASFESRGFVAISTPSLIYSPDGDTWSEYRQGFALAGKPRYSSIDDCVFLSANGSLAYTKDGKTIEYGAIEEAPQGYSLYEPQSDSVVSFVANGVAVIPRGYNENTEFALPLKQGQNIRV